MTVGRMHTRYIGAAAGYGDAFPIVVESELETALAAVTLPDGHVCLPSLTVPVRLGPWGSAARSWAEQIAAALAVAARDAVVYPRLLDAVVDLLVSVGRGDLHRAWAWRGLGLTTDPDRPDAAAAALTGRPELAVAALVAAAARGPLPLTAAGWVAVARRVGALVAPASPTGAPVGPSSTSLGDVLASPVARRLPAEITALPEADRREVGRLLVLCAAPALARSPAAVTAVAALLREVPGPRVTSEPGPDPVPHATDREDVASAAASAAAAAPAPAWAPEPDPAPRMPAADPSTPDRAPDPTRRAAPERPDPETAGARTGAEIGGPPAAVLSAAGGVFFLLAATGVPELPGPPPPPALVDQPFITVVPLLAARLGGVDLDDPAVHVLAGQPTEPLAEPTADQDAALGVLAEQVTAWFRTLLRPEPDDDLRWLWRRPARIAAEPGWVEVTYDLDDVDTRVRAAGLDLDPGFVWWLGSVVRYRYA